MSIKWGNRTQAIRSNNYQGSLVYTDYVGNLKRHIVQSNETTKKVVAKYTATKKVFTITREHSTNTIRSENGWSNNPSKMKQFETQRDAEKYMSARKIVGKIVMFESR